MSTIGEKRDWAAARVRDYKTAKVADWHEEYRPEAHPTVIGWRGDEDVVSLIAEKVDRDHALRTAYMAAFGFGCDTLAMTVDAWGTDLRKNPVTGKAWGEGEMQELVEHHQGMEKGWIFQGLNTFVVNRAGDVAAAQQRYTTTKRTSPLGIVSWTLEWTDREDTNPEDPSSHHEGPIVDILRRCMNEPTVLQKAAQIGLTGAAAGLDEVETMAHTDCGVVRAMMAQGWRGAIILLGEDSRRREIIERSLGRYLMRDS